MPTFDFDRITPRDEAALRKGGAQTEWLRDRWEVPFCRVTFPEEVPVGEGRLPASRRFTAAGLRLRVLPLREGAFYEEGFALEIE